MVVLGGCLNGSADGTAGVIKFDNYWCRVCSGCFRCVCEDLGRPVYCWVSGVRRFILSLLYYGDMNVEEVGGVADHGAVDVAVLFLVFREKLVWGGGSWVKVGVLFLRSWFWHVVYIELVGIKPVILGCVFPNESSKFYWGIGLVPVVKHGDG